MNVSTRNAFIFMIIGFLTVFLVELSFLIWKFLPLISSLIILLYCMSYVTNVGYLLAKGRDLKGATRNLGFGSVAAAVWVGSILFSIASREIYAIWPNSFIGVNENLDQIVYVREWYYFGFKQFLDSYFFEIPSIFGIFWTTIEPNSFWTRTLLFMYRFFVSVFAVETLFRIDDFMKDSRWYWSPLRPLHGRFKNWLDDYWEKFE